MTVSIGPGWSIGPGVALGGGGGGGGSTVTYTAGVEYTLGQAMKWIGGTGTLRLPQAGLWADATAAQRVQAQPAGTVYTCDASGISDGTITTTGIWGGPSFFRTVAGTGANGLDDGQDYDLTSITFTPSPLPFVYDISPDTGSTAGGDSVTITGFNFTGATSVSIGSTPVASYSVVDAQTITLVTPAGTGAESIVVDTPAGTVTSALQFNYV